jgi:hypothetical protein
MTTRDILGGLSMEEYVETFYDNGTWHSRRQDCIEPFASGATREQLIAIGAEVARWNHVRHVIRDESGGIVEVDVYGTGPYPHRSPVRRIRPNR